MGQHGLKRLISVSSDQNRDSVIYKRLYFQKNEDESPVPLAQPKMDLRVGDWVKLKVHYDKTEVRKVRITGVYDHICSFIDPKNNIPGSFMNKEYFLGQVRKAEYDAIERINILRAMKQEVDKICQDIEQVIFAK